MEPNDIISSGLLELHVLGMATEQETAQVLAMSKQYPEVAAEILSIEMSLEHYAHIHCVNPSVKLKQKIYEAISGEEKEIKVTKINPVVIPAEPAKIIPISPSWKYIAAASIILLIGSVIMNYNYYNKYETANNELSVLRNDKEKAEQQLLTQERVNDEMKNDLTIVQSKYSEPHILPALPDAPGALAKIFWMKNTNDVYIDASNLPDAPEGMQYQFWGIVDGKPVDGGLIITTKKEDKYRIQKMKSFGKAEAFAVTLETMGGNPQPKGKMYVMGKMQ
ncbi:MAG: anti-sigma factor [Ferruginibacter sp.]